jgi:hypothetical protein
MPSLRKRASQAAQATIRVRWNGTRRHRSLAGSAAHGFCGFSPTTAPTISEAQDVAEPDASVVEEAVKGGHRFRLQLRALAISLFVETRSRCSRSQASKVRTSGFDRSRCMASRASGDAPHGFAGDRRFHQLRQIKKLSPSVAPACGFDDRRRLSSRVIELMNPAKASACMMPVNPAR